MERKTNVEHSNELSENQFKTTAFDANKCGIVGNWRQKMVLRVEITVKAHTKVFAIGVIPTKRRFREYLSDTAVGIHAQNIYT